MEIEKLVRVCPKSFHDFDRNEIHIQASVDFINGKLISGHSSSSTFHDLAIITYSKIKKYKNEGPPHKS